MLKVGVPRECEQKMLECWPFTWRKVAQVQGRKGSVAGRDEVEGCGVKLEIFHLAEERANNGERWRAIDVTLAYTMTGTVNPDGHGPEIGIWMSKGREKVMDVMQRRLDLNAIDQVC
jgi:hypothetical protein